ncbi:MAG TPA: substrate-binding domain-containing protein [Steroidobacteraceae bacterium]|nr:substrate-binding domain-containing protein [Steroidobacteraceae bacterium]
MTTKHMGAPLLAAALLAAAALAAVARAAPAGTDFSPPWSPPPAGGGLAFSVAPFDEVVDLHGDVVDPQLSVFFAGNQFMVVHDLIAAFSQAYPRYRRIYVETLPPGALAAQIEAGALIMGNMRIDLKADVYTAGKRRIEALQKSKHWFGETYDYAANKLAIMVAAGNPRRLRGIADLGRADIRVSMPNPRFEGIARQIEAIYRKVGGAALERTIMETKVKAGTTILTQIHHRQTPLNVLTGRADAGVVWFTEAFFQQRLLHHPVGVVPIPDEDNLHVTYAAAVMRAAPHPRAARDFLKFLGTPTAQAIYRKYGFEPPPRSRP